MTTELPDRSTSPDSPQAFNPEQELWQLYQRTSPVNMLEALLRKEPDSGLQAVVRANFELGRNFYNQVQQASPLKPVSVGIIESSDLAAEMARIGHYGKKVDKLTGLSDDYLASIRAFRLQAAHGLWQLNLKRIRSSEEDRVRTADADLQQADRWYKMLNSAAAQLNGAAQAAFEDGALGTALLLCEAAGDFLPQGQTVVRIDENLSRKNETLGAAVRFVKERAGDPWVQHIFRETMGTIGDRLKAEQRSTGAFESKTLPKLIKPGDTHP